MDMYLSWTFLRKVCRSGCGSSDALFGVFLPGCESRPWPRPSPTGRRIETAALLNTDAGSVSDGI